MYCRKNCIPTKPEVLFLFLLKRSCTEVAVLQLSMIENNCSRVPIKLSLIEEGDGTCGMARGKDFVG